MLTILLPTQNREDFVTRALRYYSQIGCKWRLIVIDSSRKPQADLVASRVRDLSGALPVEHHRFEFGISFIEKIAAIGPLLDTPYIALSADDDFLVKSALQHGLEYLERTPTCSVVHGEAVAFSVEGDGAYGRITGVQSYPQRSIAHPTARARLLDHFGDYSTNWYSLQRTANFRRIWGELQSRAPDLHFTELLPSALTAILGTTHKLDELYMARQTATAKEYSAVQVWEWVHSAEFPQEHARFIRAVAENLAEADGTEINHSEQFVRSAFEPYIRRCAAMGPGRMFEFMQRYGLGRMLLRTTRPLRAAIRRRSSESMRTTWTSPSWAFQEAFRPIREAIIDGPEGAQDHSRLVPPLHTHS